ncbi:MAG: hypothetical protein JOY67_11395 [Hyphomicrobiales bacterium]|nr:hypothetical protein [Hyphomicrobiales bacterium]MBV9519959.1 hypothetical protein [Hyphomicrobiales bacterium]
MSITLHIVVNCRAASDGGADQSSGRHAAACEAAFAGVRHGVDIGPAVT